MTTSTLLCPRCHQAVTLLTTAEVADKLDLASTTVSQRAKHRDIGWQVDARTRLYTPADVAALRQQFKRGRPRKES